MEQQSQDRDCGQNVSLIWKTLQWEKTSLGTIHHPLQRGKEGCMQMLIINYIKWLYNLLWSFMDALGNWHGTDNSNNGQNLVSFAPVVIWSNTSWHQLTILESDVLCMQHRQLPHRPYASMLYWRAPPGVRKQFVVHAHSVHRFSAQLSIRTAISAKHGGNFWHEHIYKEADFSGVTWGFTTVQLRSEPAALCIFYVILQNITACIFCYVNSNIGLQKT